MIISSGFKLRGYVFLKMSLFMFIWSLLLNFLIILSTVDFLSMMGNLLEKLLGQDRVWSPFQF